MDLYTKVKDSLDAIVKTYRESKADGSLSLAEVWRLLVEAIGKLVQIAETFDGATGAEKKEAVIQAAQAFYDDVIRPIDLPGVPNFLENTVVDPLLGKAVPYLFGGLVDGLVGIFNREGWAGDPHPTEVEPPPTAIPVRPEDQY